MTSDTGEHDGTLEQSVQTFLKAAVRRSRSTVDAARADLLDIQNASIVARAPTTVEDLVFPVGPTGQAAVRVVRPIDNDGPLLPAIIYLHGGGWIAGCKTTHDRLVRELAARVPAVIVFVDYPLAPEAPYPIQNEQAYAVLTYAMAQAAALRLDPSRVAIAGDDAGGAIAAAVTLLAKQRRGPDINFQLLLCPITGDLVDTGSYATFRDGPWLTRSDMELRFHSVFPHAAGRRDAGAFPLLASPLQLNDLPPALVITAECDILRDEGEAYARQLQRAGVNASSTRYNGTIHDFMVLNALAESPATRGAFAQVITHLREALHDH